MKKFKLNPQKKYAQKIENGVETGIWCNVETNQEYLDWIKEGNIPDEPDPIVKPPKLNAKEKLDELGIDLKELKKLLKDTPEA